MPLADVIVPSIFNNYVMEKTAELSAFRQSGVVDTHPELDQRTQNGGALINLPFWQDLTGYDDDNLDDTVDLTPQTFGTDEEVAALLTRGKAWKETDLAIDLAGDDPMIDLANRVAEFWARKEQTALINALTGFFATAAAANAHDISGLGAGLDTINGSTFVDATQKLGDAKRSLVAVGMHSATEASLAKNDLIAEIRDSDGNFLFNSFMNLRVITDDDMPVSAGNYTTYLFGAGSVGYGRGTPKVPSETDRDSLGGGGTDIFVSRNHFVMHPRGAKWGGGTRPTNANLATGGNWTLVWEIKNVRIIQFIHKV